MFLVTGHAEPKKAIHDGQSDVKLFNPTIEIPRVQVLPELFQDLHPLTAGVFPQDMSP